MDGLTVGQAAAQTGWSPRMLRYLERAALVVPRSHRLRLPPVRRRRARSAPRSARAARALRPRADRRGLRCPNAPRSVAPRGSRDMALCERRPHRPLGRLGAAKARAAARRMTTSDTNDSTGRELMATTKRYDVQGPRPWRPRAYAGSRGPTGRCRSWPRSASGSSASSRCPATASPRACT